MDSGYRTPLLDLFRRGEVPREARLLAAQGVLAPRAHEQLGLLMHLHDDPDPDVAAAARATLDALPRPALERFLARPDVGSDLRAFFAARGIAPAVTASPDADPIAPQREGNDTPSGPDGSADDDLVLVADDEAAEGTAGKADGRRRLVSSLPITERLKLAMKGTREQRAVLIRDSNKLVAVAVLSSPKLTETEVESFARMANVSEEILRIIGTTRAWTRSYTVSLGLVRNPKTPLAISMPLIARLNDRDVKALSVDRNVPEGLRVAARKLVLAGESRRK